MCIANTYALQYLPYIYTFIIYYEYTHVHTRTYLPYTYYLNRTPHYSLVFQFIAIYFARFSLVGFQKQLIVSNTTFNAYVIANEPEISKNYENIDMRRSIILKDGVKEYWGFYLLKGSSFDVSACVR